MGLKCVALVVAAVFSLSLVADGFVVPLDRGLMSIETIYNELERKVETAYSKIRNTVAGIVLSTIETVDRHVSLALFRVKKLSEDCRLPAEISLENLSKRAKQDFRECSEGPVQDQIAIVSSKSEALLQDLRSSCNTSVSAVSACLHKEFNALRELRFDFVGSCEFHTGLRVSERFIQDAASVQMFAIQVLSSSYNLTTIVTNCFKEELVESSVDAIVEGALKCQSRIRKL